MACKCCPGACCTAGVCTQKNKPACEAGGGVWQGAGTSCTPSPCGCDLAGMNQTSQPAVTISGSTIPCDSGSHDGLYAFLQYFAGEWTWSGTASCADASGLPSPSVSVAVTELNGQINVNVFTYTDDRTSTLDQDKTTCELSVVGGDLTGSLHFDFGTNGSLDLTFG